MLSFCSFLRHLTSAVATLPWDWRFIRFWCYTFFASSCWRLNWLSFLARTLPLFLHAPQRISSKITLSSSCAKSKLWLSLLICKVNSIWINKILNIIILRLSTGIALTVKCLFVSNDMPWFFNFIHVLIRITNIVATQSVFISLVIHKTQTALTAFIINKLCQWDEVIAVHLVFAMS